MTEEQLRAWMRSTKMPYDAVTYWRHPYHHDDEYRAAWDRWFAAGMVGEEPISRSGKWTTPPGHQ